MGALANTTPNLIGGSTPLPGSLTLNVAAAPIDNNIQAFGGTYPGALTMGGQQGNSTTTTDANGNPLMPTPMPIMGNPSTPATGGGLSSLVNSGTPNMATTNPLSQFSATGATAPNLGVTAGSAPSSGGLTQGTALPNITTTQQQATATPQFYLDYLNQLATQGAGATQNAQYVGAQPLQQQAFQQAGQNVGNYQPTLSNAVNLASSVGGTSLADAIGNYGQANIASNLAPQATAGIVGSGQFGSSRGASALGQVLANADLGITQQQQVALQQDQANKIAASQQLGNLATTTQNLGLGDVNALSTLGAQQQTIAQNQQLFPMQQLTSESNLLKGATVPTATSSSYTGPIPGAYNNSPLAQIAGVGSVLAGTGLGQTLFGTPASTNGQTPANAGLFGSALTGVKNYLTGLGQGGSGATPIDTSNGITLSNGQVLSFGDPVTGTGANGGAGAGQVLGKDGNVYNDPTYGNSNASSAITGGIPPDVSVDPNTGIGSDGQDYSSLLLGP